MLDDYRTKVAANRFLAFNQGSDGAGKVGGKGNPADENGYSKALWEEELTKDSFMDLIRRFVCYVEEKEEHEVDGQTKTRTNKKVIFPRYNQYVVVKKVLVDVYSDFYGKETISSVEIQNSMMSIESSSFRK